MATCWHPAGAVRALVYLVLLYQHWPSLDKLRWSTWPYEITGRYAGGFCLVLIARYAGGGLAGLTKELHGLGKDAFGILATVKVLYLSPVTGRELCVEAILKVCLLQDYVRYGPFGTVSGFMFHVPFAVGCQLWAHFVHRSEHFKPQLEDAEWWGIVSIEIPLCALVFMIFFWMAVFAANVLHRYFSHRCFQTSRLCSFLLGAFSCMASGMRPLHYSALHRRHHRFCDQEGDPHSPYQKGFFYAYVFCYADRDNLEIRPAFVRDWLLKNPELLLLELYGGYVKALLRRKLLHRLVYALSPVWLQPFPLDVHPMTMAADLGEALAINLVSAFNGFSHEIGWGVPDTDRCSRANTCKGKDMPGFVLIGGGEAYHKEHHKFPNHAVYGPWYLDWSFCAYVAMEKCCLVWDLQRPAAMEQRVFAALRKHPIPRHDAYLQRSWVNEICMHKP
ncbi:ADS2 [Symbiodinium sp. CCMP2592]|nr:ADS2 [Symbiodinium sp. CCMP2592]